MSTSQRVALVTGAASGIGAAVVEALRAEGWDVRGADLAAGVDFVFDVRDESGWESVAEALPRLDLLVLSAGISHGVTLAETTLADWRRVQAVNLDGAFLGVRMGLRKMKAGSSIVLLGSASGKKAVAGAGAYCSSKAAVAMLTRVAALEGKPLGIRVNSVSPAGVATPMWQTMEFFAETVRRTGSEAAAWEMLGGVDPAKSPLERMAFAREIASVVLFLASEAAATLTGADLAADAGYTA
jgi:NAD(P)-dependent dehydrogenase (short-subunit alcohol dehydrogenase family)